MAIRVTTDEVKEIIDTDLTDPRITAFITGASTVIDTNLADQNLDAAVLKEIERWLSAHYIALAFERQAIHEKAGPAEQRFADVFGMYLEDTTYGQTASSLDPTGILAGLGKKKIQFKAVSEE
jgi:hypothetical protein